MMKMSKISPNANLGEMFPQNMMWPTGDRLGPIVLVLNHDKNGRPFTTIIENAVMLEHVEVRDGDAVTIHFDRIPTESVAPVVLRGWPDSWKRGGSAMNLVLDFYEAMTIGRWTFAQCCEKAEALAIAAEARMN